MTQVIKQNKWFALTALILMLTQLFLDTLNVAKFSAHTSLIIGAVAMFIALVNAGFQQYLSDLPNGTIWVQVLLFVGYIAGGVLDKLDMMPFSEDGKAIIRLALTFTSSAIPLILKYIKDYE